MTAATSRCAGREYTADRRGGDLSAVHLGRIDLEGSRLVFVGSGTVLRERLGPRQRHATAGPQAAIDWPFPDARL